MSEDQPDQPDQPTDPDPKPDVDDDRLRKIIRDEIHAIFGDADPGAPGDQGDTDDGSGMSLRQIEHRAMTLVADALAKIPGPPTTAGGRPRAEPEKQPVSRAIRFLGFHDEEPK